MICEYQDFLNLKLTGKYMASGNNVAVRWHFVDGEPPVSLLEKLELSDLVDKWPKRVVAPGDTIGDGLTAKAATHLGLAKGTPVAQGGADAFIAMLGLGVVSPGQLALITGSSHLHLGVVSHENKEMVGPGVFGAYRNALPGVSGKYFPFTTFRRLNAHTRLTLSFLSYQESWRAGKQVPGRWSGGTKNCSRTLMGGILLLTRTLMGGILLLLLTLMEGILLLLLLLLLLMEGIPVQMLPMTIFTRRSRNRQSRSQSAARV